MCLGTVAKVVEVPGEGRAVVEHGDRREEVLKMTVGDDIRPGDWVVIHSGFVLERISGARATDALAIRSTPIDTAPSDSTRAPTTVYQTTPGASAAPHEKELAP